jgi:hypothetical protein
VYQFLANACPFNVTLSIQIVIQDPSSPKDVLHCKCHSDYRIDAEILNESLDLLKDTSVAEQRTHTDVEERLQNLELMLRDLINMKVKM